MASADAFRLASPAFTEGRTIPKRHTCDGEDRSPPLSWSGAPPDTVAYALVMDDPDAPNGTWDHWVLWNLRGTSLDEGSEDEGLSGTNSWGRTGYGGPCPPSGVHRYRFRLLALDALLYLPPSTTKAQLLAAAEGHVLGEARLEGRYSRG